MNCHILLDPFPNNPPAFDNAILIIDVHTVIRKFRVHTTDFWETLFTLPFNHDNGVFVSALVFLEVVLINVYCACLYLL